MTTEDNEPARKKLKVEDDDSDEEIPEYIETLKKTSKNTSQYLNTINRQFLNFDFEKECVITLSKNNVYGCLVCGKYFQGRSTNSPAYLHSIDTNHYIYLNLFTERFYILPENYEIISSSLNDIIQLLNPRYRIEDLVEESRDLNDNTYKVGYIGLDNLSNNDYSNVVLQLISHITPLRDFYIKMTYQPNVKDLVDLKCPLNSKFGLLCRKIWSKYLFKNHVSPHDVLQYISIKTKNQFAINMQTSPKRFLVWFLNNLNRELMKTLKNPIISTQLQGNVLITKFPIVSEEINQQVQYKTKAGESLSSKFWILQLDLPTNSVFNQEIISEIDLSHLLSKYNGKKTTQVSETELRTYVLMKPLPKYILLHIDRKLENGETRGNPTVVTFPSILDFAPYTKDADECLNYELVANIEHELITGLEIDHKDDKQNWLIHLQQNMNTWYTIYNSQVSSCQRELLFAKESYIQLWKAC